MCQLDKIGSDTDEMEISDDENYGPYKNKRTKYDNEKLKVANHLNSINKSIFFFIILGRE